MTEYDPQKPSSIMEEAFGKRTPEDEVAALRSSLYELRTSFHRRIEGEREARGDLAKRVRRLERITDLLVQTVLIGLGGYLTSQVVHYWKLGEWWNVLAIIGGIALIIKLYNDAMKAP